MSISVETANAHKNDPAVLCCRAEAGTIIEVHNLEATQDAALSGFADAGIETTEIILETADTQWSV